VFGSLVLASDMVPEAPKETASCTFLSMPPIFRQELGSHGVFAGGRDAVIATIDEAYRLAQAGGSELKVTQQGARTIYTVEMGRTVGYVGGQAGAAMGHPAASQMQLVLEGRNGNVP